VLALESRIGAASEGKGYASSGRSDAATIELGWWKLPATLFPAGIAVLCLVVPVGVLALWILRGGPGYTAGGFAFEWSYGINTVVVSLVAALATTLVAIPIALSSARTETALSRLTERATYFGYATPGVVLGLALVVFGSNYAPALYQTLPLLVFAYVVRFLPQAVGTTRSSVLQVDETLVEAARTLGVSQLAAFRRVTLPLIAPGVIAGAALVFLTSMRELPATLLLHPTGFTTLVTYIWRVTDAGYYGAAAVPALALIGVSGLSMLVILSQEGDDGG
jgi:iron(III) transport system permease protein